MSQPGLPLESAAPAPPKGALMAIVLIILVDFLGFGLIIPLLPFYVPDYATNPMKVTLIFSIYSICQFIGAPILGALSDRVGRRPVLIVSQLGSAAGYILLGIASTKSIVDSDSTRLLLVYLSRVIDGFTGGNVSTAQAYISDVTTAKTRSKGMGLIGAAFGIGFCLGPFLGGVLGHYNPTWPAYAAAALAAAAAVMTWARLKESTIHKPTEVENWLHPSTFAPVLKKPVIAQLLAIAFLSMAAFVMMEATIGIFLAEAYGWNKDVATRNTGWFFGYAGLIIILIQGGLIGRLTRKGKGAEWSLAILGPLLVTAGMVFFIWIAWDKALWILAVAGLFNSIGRSLQQPTVSSLLSKHSDPKEQGVVFGLYHGLSSLARVAGPCAAGVAYNIPGLKNTGQFILAGIILALAGVWTVSLKSTAAKHAPAGTAAAPAESEAQAARSEIE